ncbi:hypothetical protein HMPREF9018_1633 [Prevotella amnii CRIS 21A-A]|uniref:DUF3822 domain-containing protein n=1 Tax=Prevotella amnii CRIS 21A-A TaxID=679191 RepID=E1GTE0_9BACT|nr:DUF3822 family protein [Prevotella amnii]EFN92116.1 hypothetical protein HMPREF9018_1633 [Prevotella amnii CRIS 21A-A]
MAADTDVKDMRLRLTIRIGRSDLSFSVCTTIEKGYAVYEPYNTNKGISVAANLREAFSVSELLQSGYKCALVLLDVPAMLIPMEEAEENDGEVLYKSAFSLKGNEEIVQVELPSLSVKAVMAINKDLKMVIDDHFPMVSIQPLMQPVWAYLQKLSYQNKRRKLFAYFHDHTMEVVSFQQTRFRYNNTFDGSHGHDALYYLLFVWRELGMSVEKDELHIMGKVSYEKWLVEELEKFLSRVYVDTLEKEIEKRGGTMPEAMHYDEKVLYLDQR